MRILITGGAGFIGSNYIHLLLKKYNDIEVVNLDKLTYAGNLDNLKDIEKNPRYRFIKGDICDPKIVSDAMKGCQQVVHFAAETHVDRSITAPRAFAETDVVGTLTLLWEAKRQNVERFVHISTDEVYGSIENGSFKETDMLKPNSPYSAGKAGSDLMALAFHKTYGTPVVITRSSNNIGPHQYPEKVVPLFITNLIQGKKVPLYGDGKNVRDWIYVEDNCEGIETIRTRGAIGEIYNIGGGNELTNIELTKTILQAMDKNENLIEKVADRLGHDRRYSLDSTKAMKLGWTPKHDAKSAIKKTIEWYKANEEWWRKLL